MSSPSSPSPWDGCAQGFWRQVRKGLKAGAWWEKNDGLFPFGFRPLDLECSSSVEPMRNEKKSCLLDDYSPSLMSLEHRWALEPTRKALASWLKYSDDGFFHITGKPGSGKTQIIDYIDYSEVARKHLQKWCKTKRLTQTKIFFWRTCGRRETSCESNLQGMLRVILWSLICDKEALAPRLFPRQYDCYLRNFDGRQPPEVIVIDDKEVLLAWDRLAKLDDIYTDDKFVLYLDGLNHFTQGFSEMLDRLKQWALARPLDVKICISSRGEAEFQDSLKSYPGIIMHEVSQADMLWCIRWATLHADKEFAALYVRNTSPPEREELEQLFLAKVNGSFFLLWRLLVRIMSIGRTRRIPKDMTLRDAIKGFVDDWMPERMPLSEQWDSWRWY